MEGKRSFEDDTINDTNSTFDNAFLGTPPTKRARRSYEPSFKIKVSRNLITSLGIFFWHAYFRAMLILRCHSLGKCLFSTYAYFQAKAYYRENTVFKLSAAVQFEEN